MFICTLKFDRKKAVFWVIMVALVFIAVILLLGARDQKVSDAPSKDVPSKRVAAGLLRTEKDRVAYLAAYGWEVESPALSEDTVVIPRSFSTVFEKYNELQKQQGFDLSQYCGMEVKLYTYHVVNHDIGDNVIAVLYLMNGSVIGGDIHSTAVDGFMCGIK